MNRAIRPIERRADREGRPSKKTDREEGRPQKWIERESGGARGSMSGRARGHVFCKECILECLLAQKKDIQRKLAAHTAQQKQEKEEEEEKLMLQEAGELDAFDQQNHGAMPQYSDKNHNKDKNGFPGANSVKATSYEEEAHLLRGRSTPNNESILASHCHTRSSC
ncbi:hypothetical protein TEA_020025 [Camellia sinensis var. sinensis]|uniref:Uncharacterized protein n=1 Tax=Camellia sinensis var. sinensis TaxID=542762 RepID=A0A4S4D1M6_CAMSN|nr:hypothetical protein TEA_020025 [Camellia sinensis var. sinensis]